jgi:acylphosphatase
VQGVNFRYYTQVEAHALGLTGWVANRADGSVELMAQGERAALEQLLAYVQQGPSHARVDRVEVEWLAATHPFDRFQIRY